MLATTSPHEIFVGRKSELARGDRAARLAMGGEKGSLLLFSGEAGIGKTRIAKVVAQNAAQHGTRVVWGRAWEAGGAPSYWPWTQVFRALGAKDDPLASEEGKPTTLADLHQARFAAFDRAARWLKNEAKEAALTIVLDDLHAADVSSLLFLHFLVRDLHGSRLFVIGTYRDVEARLAGEVGVILGKVAREGELIALGALSKDDVLAWMCEASKESAAPGDGVGVVGSDKNDVRIVPHPTTTTEEAEQVFRASEGNALFVHELLRLHHDGAANRRERTNKGPSASSLVAAATTGSGLRAILDEHFSRVSRETRSILEIASVFGRDLDAPSVAAIANASRDDVERAFREARHAGLLGSLSGAAERLSFTHILLRERLYTELMPSRRAELHSAAAEHILATIPGGATTTSTANKNDLAMAAHHFFESSSPARRIVEVALEAARTSLAKLAFEDASLLCGRALEKLARDPARAANAGKSDDYMLAIDLELTLGEALMRAGKTTLGREACVRAAALAKNAGSAEGQAQAALVFATELSTGDLDPTMIRLLRDAIDVLPGTDSTLRARVLVRYGASLVPPASNADLVIAAAHADEGVAMAKRLGDPDTLLFTLHFASSTKGYGVPAPKRIAMARELFDLAKSLNRPLVLLSISSWWIVSLRETAPLEAEAALEEYARLTQDFPQPHYRWRLPMLRATFKELEGDFEAAESLAAEALAIAEEGEVRMGFAAWAMQRISIALLSDNSAMAGPPASDRILPVIQRIFGAKPFLAWLYAVLGRRDEARLLLTECIAMTTEPCPPSSEVPGPLPWALLTGEAAYALRDREAAAKLYPNLCEHAPLNALFWGPLGCGVFGPTQRIAGDLAALIGRTDEARRWYEEVIDMADRLNAPGFRMLAARRLEALGTHGENPSSSGLNEEAAPSSKRTRAEATSSSRMIVELRREGEMWRVSSSSSSTKKTFHLKDSKGLSYLADLLARPGRELHVTQLSELVETPGDAGTVLDERSKKEYKERVEALRDQLEEARRFSDSARASKIEAEIETIAEQLAAAVGLGGRDRKVGSHVERLRINVQRRIKDAIQRIEEHDPVLGRYLTATVKTGIYCIFSDI